MKIIKLNTYHIEIATAIVDDVINHVMIDDYYIDVLPVYNLGKDILLYNSISIDDVDELFYFDKYNDECVMDENGIITLGCQLLSCINNLLDSYHILTNGKISWSHDYIIELNNYKNEKEIWNKIN